MAKTLLVKPKFCRALIRFWRTHQLVIRLAYGVICDGEILIRLKKNFYKIVIRQTITNGVKCWPNKKPYTYKMNGSKDGNVEMGVVKVERLKIRNECF